VSQAIGAGNSQLAGVWLQLAVVHIIFAMIPVISVCIFFVDDILLLLGFNPEIASFSVTYAKWMAVSQIPNCWYMCLRFFFQAQGITRPAMYNGIVFLFVNALLDWFFIFYLDLGFVGAPIATSTSRCLQLLVYWVFMFVIKKEHVKTNTWAPWSKASFGRQRRHTIQSQVLGLMGGNLFEALVDHAPTLIVSSLGTTAIASSSAIESLMTLFAKSAGVSLVMISGVRVGLHMGSGDVKSASGAAWLVQLAAFLWSLVYGIPFIVWPKEALSLITSDATVLDGGSLLMTPVVIGNFAMIVVMILCGGILPSLGPPMPRWARPR